MKFNNEPLLEQIVRITTALGVTKDDVRFDFSHYGGDPLWGVVVRIKPRDKRRRAWDLSASGGTPEVAATRAIDKYQHVATEDRR